MVTAVERRRAIAERADWVRVPRQFKSTDPVSTLVYIDDCQYRRYTSQMRFDWDEAKRQGNIEKHGIDFLRAAIVAAAPMFTRQSDRRGEQRWVCVGELEGRVVAVVYTDRTVVTESGTVTVRRIISARRATKWERNAYDEARAK